IPLLAGRLLGTEEPAASTLLSASLAHMLWPDRAPRDVVGLRVRPGGNDVDAVTVVGVVKDVRGDGLEKDPLPPLSRHYSQEPFETMPLVVRTARRPETLAPALRAAVTKLDRSLAIPNMRTMGQIISSTVARRRFQMTLVLLFAALALVLAVVGI